MTDPLTETERQIQEVFDGLVEEVHEWAKGKGWWDKDPNRNFGELNMLVVTEIAECYEQYREYGMDPTKFIYDNPDPNKAVDTGCGLMMSKPEGIASELADIFIRIFDFCGHYQIPITDALISKLRYNNFRPYRHGNKHA